MLLFQSEAGEYYALCGNACKSFLHEWLTNPDAKIKPTERVKFVDGGDEYVPYACSFCSLPIDPTTWGTPVGKETHGNQPAV